jgi:hypothetical protein
MMRLPDSQMSELLKFGLRVNEAQKLTGGSLALVPDDVHKLLKANRSIFCATSGSATRVQSLVRRIERCSPVETRKWSNDCCVVRSYALHDVGREGYSRAILSVGRNQLADQIVCAMFSRNRTSKAFSATDVSMCHFAIGYVLDSIGWRNGPDPLAYEVMGPKRRRLQGGDASLLSARIDQFLLDIQ